MKKILVVLMILMCSVALFADAPVEGAYIGADMVGISEGDFPISGAILQLSPTDMPIDTYLGVGINDKFVKAGIVFTPWEFARVPIGMYAGGGVSIQEETSGELIETFSGVSFTGIGEVGAVILFTPAVQMRIGYTYFNQVHTANIGMVVGWSKKGLGVYKGDKE